MSRKSKKVRKISMEARKRRVYGDILIASDKVNLMIDHLPYQKSGISGFQAHLIIPAIEKLKQSVEEYPTSDGSIYTKMPKKLWKKIKCFNY